MSLKVKKRIWIPIVSVIVIALVAARLYLPIYLKNTLNEQLKDLDIYAAKVDDIDLSVFAVWITFKDITTHKKGNMPNKPFLTIKAIHTELAWNVLWETGKLTTEVDIVEPRLNFIANPDPRKSQLKVTKKSLERLDEIIPLELNDASVFDGEIWFFDQHTSPELSVNVDHVALVVRDLQTLYHPKDGSLPTPMLMYGETTGGGQLTVDASLNPESKPAQFDVNLRLENLYLRSVNPWLREYAKMDVEQGAFSMYAELASADNAIDGYMKPMLRHVEITTPEEKDIGFWQKIKEGLADLGKELLENEDETIATRVPIHGNIKDPDIRVFTTVVILLRNAFFEKVIPGLNNNVGPGNVALMEQRYGGQE